VSAHIFPIRDADGQITHFIDVEEDVTERKMSERELHKLLMALDQSPNSITIADNTGKITYVNSAFTRLTGIRREEVVGKGKIDLSREPAPHGRISSIMATIMSGKDWKSERRTVKKDGSELWISVHVSPIRDAGGNVEYLVIIEEDITERKQAEEKLLLTQTSIDHFHDPCTWADEEGHILYANDAACQTLRYSREELLRMKIQDIDPLIQDAQYYEIFQRLKIQQGSTHFESVHKASDGRIFPVEISTKMVRFGDRDYAVSIDRDITERKMAEAELRKLSIAVEQSPASVKIVGLNGRIAYVNPKLPRCPATGRKR
jgi:PAS domain S-box-containing protein